MKIPRFRWFVGAGIAVGLLIPAASQWLPYSRFTVILLQLWPTSIFLMATAGHEHEFGSYLLVAEMVLANVLVYVIAFSFIWCIGWVLRAWRASLRDGTTI